MKSTLFLAAMACLLSITLAADSEKIEQVNDAVGDYIREHMVEMPMWRSAVDHFACYDDLTRKINTITDEANDKSEQCIKTASDAKATTLESLKRERVQVSAEVSKVHNSFFECTRKSVGLEYFECLKSAVGDDTLIMEGIKQKAEQMIDQYSDGLNNIDKAENECLARAIDEAKTKSDEGFRTLRSCLGQGSPNQQPAPSA